MLVKVQGVTVKGLKGSPVAFLVLSVVEQVVEEVSLLLAHGINFFGDDPVHFSFEAGRNGDRPQIIIKIEGLIF